MRFARQKKSEAMIPTASMADIAFLLIIFFMVTTVHELDRTSVNLPLAKTREEAEKGAAIVVLHEDETNGEFIYKFSNGDTTSQVVPGPEDIYLEASRLTYGDSSKQFILKADGNIRFEKIDELLDNMRKGGVQRVLLLTAQNTSDSTGGG